jgi:iron complex transport system substrate-binding protein
MKTLLAFALLGSLGLGLAQETPPQVEGFPPFSPPVPMFTVIEGTEDGYLISHKMGETLALKSPQRIFALDLIPAEALISLDAPPIGLASPWLPEVVAEAAPEMAFLRTAQDLNLEAILALEPDLIIGSRLVGDDPNLYEQVSRIAPTVILRDEAFAYWQQLTYDLAGLLNVPEHAEEVIQSYNDAVANYRERAQAVIGEESINTVLVFPQSLWLYAPGAQMGDRYVPSTNSGWPYIALGLNPSPEMVSLLGREAWVQLSFELLPELTAEHLIILYDGTAERAEIETTYRDFTDHPLWERVAAVQAGNVYVVDVERPIGYYSTLEVLKRFDAVLHGEESD